MAIYDFTNFERQGHIENDVLLNSAHEIVESIINNAENTLRTIKIFTPDLEHEIYNNDDFRTALLDFSRGNRHAQIKILLSDITNALHNGHMIIGLAQQMPSIITIKDTTIDFQAMNIAFSLFDQTRFIFKPDKNSHMAIQSSCKNRSDKLNDFFISAWEQAEQNSHTRRLSI